MTTSQTALALLVAIAVVWYAAYGHRLRRGTKDQNRERLERRRHRGVTLQYWDGKWCISVRGRVEEVRRNNVIIREPDGRLTTVPLTSIRRIMGSSATRAAAGE